MDVKKNQKSYLEGNRQFEQLLKIGVVKQLQINGVITEKQYQYILKNLNNKRETKQC